ncbi:MAG TPA: hypothetical protein VIF60_09265 [Burkholderiaceae bacterium]|jgi:hypothetical protein
MHLFALMNSAPAELLHRSYPGCSTSAMDRPSSANPNWRRRHYLHVSLAKKNAGSYASVGILFTKNKSFLKEKAAIAD